MEIGCEVGMFQESVFGAVFWGTATSESQPTLHL